MPEDKWAKYAEKPADKWAQYATPTIAPAPKRERGVLGKIWDWANEGIVSKDTFVRAMTGMAPEQLDDALKSYPEESPVHAAIREFTRGSLQDAGATASSFTSPLAIGTMATGGAGKIPGAVGKVARAATTGAAAGFGAQGASQTIENAPEALRGNPAAAQRALQGGAMAAGGAAGVGTGMAGVPRAYYNARTASVRAVLPEVANLPVKAIYGGERLFRAAAPVGSNTAFRGNLYAGIRDLAEIGRKIELTEASGGTIQPDMRPAAAVRAINEHLKQMYQTERAPQISRHSDAAVVPHFGTDAAEALKYVARTAGEVENRALASRALDSESLPLGEIDKLARIVNQELRPLRGMTPQELAAAGVTNRRLASLKQLDSELSDSIATELSNRGEAGIKPYERRYAAVSAFRDQLQTRINAVELQRTNVAGRLVRAVVGGKSGIASASQAAVADVNIGRELKQGFKILAHSGIQPYRPTGIGVTPVRGLIGPGNTRLPSEMQPVGQPSVPPETPPTLIPQGDLFQLPVPYPR